MLRKHGQVNMAVVSGQGGGLGGGGGMLANIWEPMV